MATHGFECFLGFADHETRAGVAQTIDNGHPRLESKRQRARRGCFGMQFPPVVQVVQHDLEHCAVNLKDREKDLRRRLIETLITKKKMARKIT